MEPREALTAGPPPHARGARLQPAQSALVVGTTPARAGSTRRTGSSRDSPRDHPRTRGEHILEPSPALASRGPPPHARGAHSSDRGSQRRRGTTPARAGSTPWAPGPRGAGGDHPRTRGEHIPAKVLKMAAKGPPPHARGAPDRNQPRDDLPGTTPARAGSTSRSCRRASASRDHPRTRGEHRAMVMDPAVRVGPPPHARGAPRHGHGPGRAGGTTPARAGSTGQPHPVAMPRWDHPRTRGEHISVIVRRRGVGGPPPHARGAPRQGAHRFQHRGTTPARAGSTRSSTA